MAFANVQSSGAIVTGGTAASWTPGSGVTINNMLSCRVAQFGGSAAPSTTSCHDATGTPKTLTRDAVVGVVNFTASATFSFLIPSGTTAPFTQDAPGGSPFGLIAMFDEWSGNSTSAPLANTSNSASAGGAAGATATSGSVSTGANVGMVLASMTFDDDASGGTHIGNGLAVTGTSFVNDAIDTFQDAICYAFDHRFTSVASATLNDSWSWTDGNSGYTATIAAYNASAALLPPGLGPAGEMEMATQSAISAMMR